MFLHPEVQDIHNQFKQQKMSGDKEKGNILEVIEYFSFNTLSHRPVALMGYLIKQEFK